jgi:decaprenylphospho-beta-D-ribofuranose 2-oxidase
MTTPFNVTGWGGTPVAQMYMSEFTYLVDLQNFCRGYIPVGLHRSYGDSALNSGGMGLRTSNLKDIYIDEDSGLARCGGGVSIAELEQRALEFGFFPPVVPGTANVTIGGAIASDIHGKSHHRVGSFSNHLLEMKLLNSDGTVKVITPSDEEDKIFKATVGGMGLTGLILEVTIQLLKVETDFVNVHEKRVYNLDELLETLSNFNKSFLYTVAWVDLSGKFNGRGIVSGANHASKSIVSTRLQNRKVGQIKINSISIPVFRKISFINSASITLFNKVWFYKPLRKRIQRVRKFMHPLDRISNWNEIYGQNGFIQYQFVIPFEKKVVLKDVLEKLKSAKCYSFLTVLKSFSGNSLGLLGFPMEGWTLAVDIPSSHKKLDLILNELDTMVVNAGGRIYLTKDSCMDSRLLPKMYPHLEDWKEMKKQIDPNSVWQSDQGRRLGLC